MTAFPPDPHTLLIESIAILEGLSGLAAHVSEDACPISGFSLMVLLETLIDRLQRAKALLETPVNPARER